MSKITKTPLGHYLGLWKYADKSTVKYYQVIPSTSPQGFIITWGKTIKECQTSKNKIVITDPQEVYKRILSKVRGGFVMHKRLERERYTVPCYKAFDTIEEVIGAERIEFKKRKPRVRKLSLLDWMSGLDEHREDEKL